MKTPLVLLALALGASSHLVLAQDGKAPAGAPPEPPPAAPGEPPARGPGGPGGQRPMSPIIAALDLNKDGVIDAAEMAKAAESLKTLDKNGDGKLSEDEYRPQRPPGGPGGQGGLGGPGGQGGRGERGPSAGGPGGQGAGKGGQPARPALEQ